MKECFIIGYKPCQNKETKEDLLRIIISKKSDDINHVGLTAIVCFLEPTDELKNVLDTSIKNGQAVYYETTDNIETGKTRIKSFHF